MNNNIRFYLSSYRIGNKCSELVRLMPANKKIAYIPNALDCYENSAERKESDENGMSLLKEQGLDVEMLDLRDYFGKKDSLRKKLLEFGGVWVRGENTFVLRQAMHLSRFDELIKEKLEDDFLYSGYSAGICILAPSLKWLDIVDDANQKPYGIDTIWEGLGILDHIIFPHYKSEHPEAKYVNKEVLRAKKAGIDFETLEDGEVIIIE